MSIYGFTIKDMFENGRVDQKDFGVLKKWIATQKIPQYPDETIALFYISRERSVEEAKKCAIAYFNAKRDSPDLFDNKDLASEEIQKQLNTSSFCILPKRTDEGYAIVLHRLRDSDPSAYDMAASFKVFFMTLDAVLYDNPPMGIIAICDMSGTTMEHLPKIEASIVRRFLYYVQEGLPMKIISVEVLNPGWYTDKLAKKFVPFLKMGLHDKIHVYHSRQNMEESYEQRIPKKCLPSDYGGNLSSIDELRKETLKIFARLSDYFKKEELSRKM